MSRTRKGTKQATRDPAVRVDRKIAFLAALRAKGVVLYACQRSRVKRTTAYEWKAADEAFAREWTRAIEDATDGLELEARRRAVNGVKKPVYQQGELVGHVQEYSDSLLQLLLRANRPEKYRERYEITGKDGAALTGVLLVPGTAKPEEWAALVAANTPKKPTQGESK